jgi:hypothetical protein
MQKHEGPRRDRAAEERQRQNRLTVWLAGVIGILSLALAVIYVARWA